MYYATSYFVLIKRINLMQFFFKLLGQVILKQKQKGSIKELTQTAILYSSVIFIFSEFVSRLLVYQCDDLELLETLFQLGAVNQDSYL